VNKLTSTVEQGSQLQKFWDHEQLARFNCCVVRIVCGVIKRFEIQLHKIGVFIQYTTGAILVSDCLRFGCWLVRVSSLGIVRSWGLSQGNHYHLSHYQQYLLQCSKIAFLGGYYLNHWLAVDFVHIYIQNRQVFFSEHRYYHLYSLGRMFCIHRLLHLHHHIS